MAITTVGTSGLPISTLLDQLQTAEETKLTPIATKQKENTSKITAYGTLKSSLTALQTAANNLAAAKTFSALKTTVSGTGVAAASDTTAIAGSHVVQVTGLAQAQTLATTGVASKTTGIDGSGTLTLTNAKGVAVNVNIADNSTLEDVRSAINAANAGVTASIISTGDTTNPYRLVMSSNATGTDSSVSASFSGTGSVSTLLSDGANGGTMTEQQTAKNATMVVDGLTITSQSNTIKDAIQGVTMTVSQVGAAQTVGVTQDTDSIKTAINAFVSAYNAMVSSNKSLTAFNSDSTLSGALLGDSTLRGIQNDIRTAINTAQTGTFSNMSQFGVALGADGKMTVNDAKLTAALNDSPKDVTEFFTGSTTSGSIGFAKTLTNKLTPILQTAGKLDAVTTSLTDSNKDLESSYARMEDTIAATMARYKVQFTALESNVTSMNSTMTYLTAQFAAMNKNSD
jgi:flagellar hook-associated protein 2